MLPTIHVSQHALDRWRERAAQYATEGIHHVISAFEQSDQLDANQVPSKYLDKSAEYYYHKPTHGLFIVGPYRNSLRMIVTYVDLPRTIKPKYRSAERSSIPRIEYLETDPEFRDPQDKSVWLNQQIMMTSKLASDIVNRGRAPSDERVFAYLKRLYAWQTSHREVLKEIKKASKLAKKLNLIRGQE